MVIGLCTVELHFPNSHSLKAKRQILSSIKTRLRGHLNVSVAEVSDQELWQKSVLGIVSVSNESSRVNQVLDQALNTIESNPSVEMLRSHLELL